jgi:predicted Zn-dependent protease
VFKRAVEVEPKSVVGHLNLGGFYWTVGQLPDSERELKAAAAIDPRSTEAARALATFYVSAKRRAEAEPYFKVYATSGTQARLAFADYYLDDRRNKEASVILEALSQEKDARVPAKARLRVSQRKPKTEAYAMVDDLLKSERPTVRSAS